MRLQFYNIIPALQPYIKLICTMDCDKETDTQHIRVLPDTCVELFLNYTSTPVAIIADKLHKRSIVTFRMSAPMDVQMRKGSGCMAVCFHPGMAWRFFGEPMHVLSDTTTALSDVWKHKAAEIEDKLSDNPDNTTRVNLVQNFLLQLLTSARQDMRMEHCLTQVQNLGGLMTVNELSAYTGLSQRQLSRKFQQYIGLSPKEYLRVNRFLRSLSYLKKQPDLPLTTIAYQSGYYDQAHFIRDYKTFSGHTPGEVVRAQQILY